MKFTLIQPENVMFVGRDQRVKATLVMENMDIADYKSSLRLNLYVNIPVLGKEIKKSLVPVQVDDKYQATFDFNNVLWSEMQDIVDNLEEDPFSFPGDPDATIVSYPNRVMTFFWNWSVSYVNTTDEMVEAEKSNNATDDSLRRVCLLGGLSRVVQAYWHKEDIDLEKWIDNDGNERHWLSWIPNNLPVHPRQPVRLWFYNHNHMRSIRLKVKTSFTDGTESNVTDCGSMGESQGLFEVCCGPFELRLPTIDISKTVASYQVWLEEDNSVVPPETFERYTFKGPSHGSLGTFARFLLPENTGKLHCSFKVRLHAGTVPQEGMVIYPGTTTETGFNPDRFSPKVNVSLTGEFQHVTIPLTPETVTYNKLTLAFTSDAPDADNYTIPAGTVIDIKDLKVFDENDKPVTYSIDAQDYYNEAHETITVSNSDTPRKTETKTFVIDSSSYERNDVLFFRTSLGVHEVLWCHGRRSENRDIDLKESIRPLTIPSLTRGTIRAGRGNIEQGYEMNTGWYPKPMRHYLADFVSAGETVLPVGFFMLPGIIEKGKYKFGEDGEDLFSLAFKLKIAHTESHFSPVPDLPSPWGDFNNDFNEDFFI
ncbi:hypothetical protein DMA11_10415 [Marinilabiliaceae bacterium JC017]|nr:hypothetical protein DMA11_10415 [Marinilabiliaceae bacterium JC017]